MSQARRLAVLACPSLKPELALLATRAGTAATLRFLEIALHDKAAPALRAALQDAIDGTTDCDAVAIAYGLCNRGVIGLRARDVPLVLPRAPDCIALLLGSRERHLAELEKEPGTYFESAGWLAAARETPRTGFTFGPASNVTLQRLADRYGDEAARYLMGEFEGFTRHYKRLAFIATPAAAEAEPDARDLAERQGLTYHRLEGDTGWLTRLLDRPWDTDEFLVVPPGGSVAADSERLIEAAP